MPETALARYKARQAQRDALIEEYVQAARSRALDHSKTTECRAERHSDCTGLLDHDFSDCLCTCHDPAWTYWVEWSTCNGELTPGSLVSGHYGTVDEAIDDGLAAKPAEAAWIRANHEVIEQVTEERWDALMAWDEKTDAEKAELRAAINRGGGDA